MIDKLGPAVCWALYLFGVRTFARQALPFIIYVLIATAVMWILYEGWLSEAFTEVPPHHSPLTGKDCHGLPIYVEHRKFWLGTGEYMEITKQCPVCKVVFFSRQNLSHTTGKP